MTALFIHYKHAMENTVGPHLMYCIQKIILLIPTRVFHVLKPVNRVWQKWHEYLKKTTQNHFHI